MKTVTITRVHEDFEVDSESFESGIGGDPGMQTLLAITARIAFDMGRVVGYVDDKLLSGFRWVVSVDGEQFCSYGINVFGEITMIDGDVPEVLTKVEW